MAYPNTAFSDAFPPPHDALHSGLAPAAYTEVMDMGPEVGVPARGSYVEFDYPVAGGGRSRVRFTRTTGLGTGGNGATVSVSMGYASSALPEGVTSIIEFPSFMSIGYGLDPDREDTTPITMVEAANAQFTQWHASLSDPLDLDNGRALGRDPTYTPAEASLVAVRFIDGGAGTNDDIIVRRRGAGLLGAAGNVGDAQITVATAQSSIAIAHNDENITVVLPTGTSWGNFLTEFASHAASALYEFDGTSVQDAWTFQSQNASGNFANGETDDAVGNIVGVSSGTADESTAGGVDSSVTGGESRIEVRTRSGAWIYLGASAPANDDDSILVAQNQVLRLTKRRGDRVYWKALASSNQHATIRAWYGDRR